MMLSSIPASTSGKKSGLSNCGESTNPSRESEHQVRYSPGIKDCLPFIGARGWHGSCCSNAFVVAVQKESEVIVRIEDISLLEAHQNSTLAHFPDGKVLIPRSLADCECRLDSSIFFRASSRCIVNLSQVKQSRLSKDGGLIFLLRDEKEVVLSRRQSVLFRKTRGL